MCNETVSWLDITSLMRMDDFVIDAGPCTRIGRLKERLASWPEHVPYPTTYPDRIDPNSTAPLGTFNIEAE